MAQEFPLPPVSPSPFYDTTVHFTLAWLNKHMDTDCRSDAMDYNRHRPPLHFKSTALILGRNYTLELRKKPGFYWLQEFTVTPTAKPPSSAVPSIVTHNVVTYTGGFYHVVSEVSADYEYLIRMHITRC